MQNGTICIKELRIKNVFKDKIPNFFDPYARLFVTVILYDFNTAITVIWPKKKHSYDEYITFLGKNNTRILKNLTFSLQEVEKLNSSVHLLFFLGNMEQTRLSEPSFELALKTHISSFEHRESTTSPALVIKQLIKTVEHFPKDDLGNFVNILTQPLSLKKKIEKYSIRNETIEIDFTVTL